MRTTTQAFVLAGGQGQRLLPLTAARAKPALSFGGTSRIIDFTLSNCSRSKLDRVAVLTQYQHDDLAFYVNQRWCGLSCLPPENGKRYRGTADAVFQNLPIIHEGTPDHVLILSGDHIYEMDYRHLIARHVETDADLTISAVEHPVKDASHFGVIEVDEDFRVTGFHEKPSVPRSMPSRPDRALISMGIYIFKTDVLIRALLANCDSAFGYDFGHNVIPSLVHTHSVHAYDFRDEAHDAPRYWRDIGTIDSYYAASMDMLRGHAPLNPPPVPLRASVCGNAHVSHSVVSSGVRIEEKALIANSVLMPGVRIGRGAQIRNAIIGEGVQIPPDFPTGWDIQQDSKHHIVSPNGVVVVGETPKVRQPVIVRFQLGRLGRTRPARNRSANIA